MVAEIDGFLELGDTHVNIPWEMVSTEAWTDGLAIPFTEDEVDAYTVPSDETGVEIAGDEELAEVSGDAFQDVETGPNVWRATDLLNNTARLREGEAYENYGLVNDIDPARRPDRGGAGDARRGRGRPGRHRLRLSLCGDRRLDPGHDGRHGDDGTMTEGDANMAAQGTTGMTAGTYDLPYDRTQAELVQPFDPAMLAD